MIQIYDSVRQSKHEFIPVEPGKVKMYVCGMTVYDDCHVGHSRAWVLFDVIARYFRARGFDVTYVRNITDIDDKIINRANENKATAKDWAEKNIASMHEDMKALDINPVEHEPRATEYTTQMINLIETLIGDDHAYVAGNGDVCFRVRSFDQYGKLSKRDLDKLRSGARVDVADGKEDPLDFVLWKLAKPNEPHWPSPWGEGRPGWHIECSAMAAELLGQPFDIHGGGMDLKFPHHENEIAQSEAGCDHAFANTWMHVGLLQINSEKMSKSLGNFSTIKDELKKYPHEVIRYFMMSAHYRSPVNYSDEIMLTNWQSLKRLYTALRGLPLQDEAIDTENEYWQKFQTVMDDDFNTPEALAVLFDMSHAINRAREQGKDQHALGLANQLKAMAKLLGLVQQPIDAFLQGDVDEDDAALIEKLIAERQQARADKDWARADKVRDQLTAMSVVIEDGASGTIWRKDTQ
ncbi:MAG: cysteine--tRNA ligase [Coxiellaceae bacterium]|nr:cysteine--tRNA ligase [Coxiellaceae bacterium]